MKNLLIASDEHGRERALSRFLSRLLDTGVVDGLVVPAEAAPGVVSHMLARDPRLVERWARPLSPVVPTSAARAVARVVRKRRSGRVAAVLRPCEGRALVELMKLNQASPETVVAINTDCVGTYDPVAYREANGRTDSLEAREACRVCVNPVPLEDALPGVALGFIGLEESDGIIVSTHDRLEPAVAAAVEELCQTAGEEALARRTEAVRALAEERRSAYAAFHAARTVSGIEEFSRELGACTGCHNCRVACPVCYCRECIFDTDTFEHDLSQFLRRAGRKGALKVPSETVLYHLTRMNHMSLSCVGCGQCEQACPARIPLFRLFAMASRRTQAVFGYVPGRSLDEELPFTTFREDELEPR